MGMILEDGLCFSVLMVVRASLREGDHKGRPYVPSFSLSEGEGFFSNHRRVDLGSERAKVGWCVIQ